jgi:ArsR family transcriptional regulator
LRTLPDKSNIGFPDLDVVLVLTSKSTQNDHQSIFWRGLPVHPALSPSDVLTRLTTPRLSGGVTGSFQRPHHITRREYILVQAMEIPLVPITLLEAAAERFRILSEPVRLALLNHLNANGEMSVQQLVDATGERQSNVSKHLGQMAQAGMLGRRRSGQNVLYRVIDPTISALCLLVCGQLQASAPDESTTSAS